VELQRRYVLSKEWNKLELEMGEVGKREEERTEWAVLRRRDWERVWRRMEREEREREAGWWKWTQL
jgi:hypothetical protein